MPLHDSFQKKSGKPAVTKLSAVPSPDDLFFAQSSAQLTPRRPVSLVWPEGSQYRMLSVIFGTEPSTDEPTWILRDGETMESPILWQHITVDAQAIHIVLTDALNEPTSPAVIPDFLRPQGTSSADGGQRDPYSPGREERGWSSAPSPPHYSEPVRPQETPSFTGAVPQTAPPKAKPSPEARLSQGEESEKEEGEEGQDDSDEELIDDEEEPGTLFGGRYEIIAQIGRGAMGSVYKARQNTIGRKVALKILHSKLAEQKSYLKRFEHEAKAASNLFHANLIVLHDFGYSETGRPYLVMDLVEGPTLDEVLDQTSHLSLQLFFEVMMQICDGLSHAHAQGIIHRDLKPGNIKITKDPKGRFLAKILDFGVAKFTINDESKEQSLTRAGEAVGSPLYMSPEQCLGDKLDARSDIYSLGCLMYEALTGIAPFLGKTALDTMYQHLGSPPEPFSDSYSDLMIPEAVEALVLKCLNKKREERFQSVDELGKELSKANQQWQASRQTPATQAANLSVSELLRQAGIISEEDFSQAQISASLVECDITAFMVALGDIDPKVLEAARKSVLLINESKLKLGQAVVLVKYVKRSGIPFEQCLKEMGWNVS